MSTDEVVGDGDFQTNQPNKRHPIAIWDVSGVPNLMRKLTAGASRVAYPGQNRNAGTLIYA